MAAKLSARAQELVARAAELSEEERQAVVEAISAKLLKRSAAPGVPRLLDLAGTGQGLWGDDSSESLRQLRNEWD
jgi:hypothetical protein